MSITSRLTLLISGLIILGMLINGAVFFYLIRGRLVDEAGAAQHELAHQVMGNIDSLVQRHISSIELLAKDDRVIQMLVSGSAIAPGDGGLTLQGVAELGGPWESLSLINAQGRIIASSQADLVGGSASQLTDNFFSSVSSLEGDVRYSDAVPAKDGEGVSMYFVAPITAGAGIDGAIVGVLPWALVEEEFDQLSGYYVYLLRSDGVIIGRGGAAVKDGEEVPFLLFKNTSSFQGDDAYHVTAQGITAGGEVVSAYAPSFGYLDYPGLGWRTVVELPLSEVIARLTGTAWDLVIVAIPVIVSLIVIIVMYLRVGIVAPVLHISETMRRMRAGDNTAREVIVGSDEVSELAENFNELADSLLSSQRDLESGENLLKSKVLELERTKSAMLNVLEDFEREKLKVLEEKTRSEATLSQIGDGIVAADPNGVITLMNEGAEQMFGFERGEMVGKPVDEALRLELEDKTIVDPKIRPIYLALELGKIEKLPEKTTFYFVRKDGERFVASITASPVVINGKVLGVVAVIRDITREASIDRAKTEFVSLASHQLRTPLSAISWYAEMLMNGDVGKVTKKQKELIDEIYRSSGRMTDLVSALLNVSRIDLGTFPVDPKPLDLREVANDIAKELEVQILKKKIHLSLDLPKDFPIIPADPKLTRIIFQNLMSNAVKYTPDEGKVWVAMVERQKEDDVYITVKDNGFGIPKAEHGKIFGKLYRAENVRGMDVDGTGLGLYIVKAIIEQSGGKVWFESEEGKGTTFFVSLPRTGMKKKSGTKALS